MPLPNHIPSRSVGVRNQDIEYQDEIRAGSAEKLPGGVLYDPNLTREVRVGELLAINSDTGRAWPRRSTELSVQAADTDTEITVDDAHAWEVGDPIQVGDADETTVAAVDYDTNVITLTAALANGTSPYAVNTRVYDPNDNMGTADGIAAERYTPREGSGMVGQGSMYIAGLFYKSKLKGSADGVDTQGNTDLGGTTISRSSDPEGDLYRIG